MEAINNLYYRESQQSTGDENAVEQSENSREASEAAGRIRYSGFSAQDVDAAAKSIGYDFSGVDKSSETLGLRYAEFVVPLIKAVQEQQEVISDFGIRISELLKQNEDLLKRIEALEGK